MSSENIIKDLIDELTNNRSALLVMIEDLEKLKEKVDVLIPNTLDNRNVRYLQMKIESASTLFETLLKIRQEITKLILSEIEVRNKNDDQDIPDLYDISEKLDMLRKQKENTEKTIETFM